MATLEVVFSDKGLDKVVKACEKAAQSFATVGKRQQTTTDAFTKGPFARLRNYQAQMAKAQASGNVTAQRDLSYLIARTQKQINGMQPKSFGSKVLGAVGSSRLNLGGGGLGISPLVGQLAAVAGPEVAGILALGGAAYGAAAAIEGMTRQAADLSNRYASLGFAAGSRGVTAGTLSTLSNVSGKDLGALAASLNSSITSDPTAMAFGARAGIRNLPGPYGDQDWGKNLVKAIEYMRSLPDFTEKVRFARGIQQPDILDFANISPQQWDITKQQAGTTANVFNDKNNGAAATFDASVKGFEQSVDTWKAAAMSPVYKNLTTFFNWLSDHFNTAAQQTTDQQKDALDKHTEAMDKHTDALDNHAQALGMNGIPGYYGLGPRGQQGLPPEIGGEYLRRGLEAGGFRLGAF